MKIVGLLGLLCIAGTNPSPGFASISFDLQQTINEAMPSTKITVPSGHYVGTFVITKPLTLEGSGEVILDGQGQGTVILVTSPDVTLLNLSIINTGESIGGENSGVHAENAARFRMSGVKIKNALFGIRIMASPHTQIDTCEIIGKDFDLGRRGDGIKVWYSPRTQIRKSIVQNSRDILVWYSDHSVIVDSRIENNRYGIHYMYSHYNLAAGNDIRSNSVGIYNMYSHALTVRNNVLIDNRGASGYGFAVKESNQLTLMDNRILNNRFGIHFDNSPIKRPETSEELTIVKNNLVAYNDVGMNFIGPGEWVQVFGNDFYQNWQQVRSDGSRLLLANWTMNYWSDYSGFDRENDGIGSIAYRSVSIVDQLLDRNPDLQVFRYSPAILAVEFAERTVPWLMEKPRFEDPSPVMRMKFSLNLSSPNGIHMQMLVIGGFLLALGAALTGLMTI